MLIDKCPQLWECSALVYMNVDLCRADLLANKHCKNMYDLILNSSFQTIDIMAWNTSLIKLFWWKHCYLLLYQYTWPVTHTLVIYSCTHFSSFSHTHSLQYSIMHSLPRPYFGSHSHFYTPLTLLASPISRKFVGSLALYSVSFFNTHSVSRMLIKRAPAGFTANTETQNILTSVFPRRSIIIIYISTE